MVPVGSAPKARRRCGRSRPAGDTNGAQPRSALALALETRRVLVVIAAA